MALVRLPRPGEPPPAREDLATLRVTQVLSIQSRDVQDRDSGSGSATETKARASARTLVP